MHITNQSSVTAKLESQLSILGRIESEIQTLTNTQRQLNQESSDASRIHQQPGTRLDGDMPRLLQAQEQLQILHEDIQKTMAETQAKMEGLVAKRDIKPEEMTPGEFEDLSLKCLKALFVTDPAIDMMEITNRKDKLVPDSCEWALEILYEFLCKDPSDRLWLQGSPGKGKTMIAIAFVEDLLNVTAFSSRAEDIIEIILQGFRDTIYCAPDFLAHRISRFAVSQLSAVARRYSNRFRPIPRIFQDEAARRLNENLNDLISDSKANQRPISETQVDTILEEADLHIRGGGEVHDQRFQGGSFVGYFFCDNTSNRHSSLVHVLQSLLRQLLKRVLVVKNTSAKDFLEDFKSKGELMFSSLEATWAELQKVLGWVSLHNVYFIVDGLDECDERSLERFFTLLIANNAPEAFKNPKTPPCRVKWVFLSRYVSSSLTSTKIVDLEDNSHAISNAVTKYIEMKVEELSKTKGYGLELQRCIATAFQRKADGTFLWVALAYRELRKLKVRSIHILGILERLPPGLNQLYARIYDQIMSNEFPDMIQSIIEILRAVVLAGNELTTTELAVVAGLPVKNPDQVEEFIEQCGSFLSMRRKNGVGRVILVHQSAKDYLLQPRDKSIFSPDCAIEHEAITLRCLEYVTSLKDCFSKVDALNRSSSLEIKFDRECQYPLRSWLRHGNLAFGHNRPGLQDARLEIVSSELFRPESTLWRAWVTIFDKDLRGFPVSHFAAFRGATWILEIIARQGHGMESMNKAIYGVTALQWAVQVGDFTTVRWLLERGASPGISGDSLPESPTQSTWSSSLAVAAGRYPEIFQLLLDFGAQINHKNRKGETPLFLAVKDFDLKTTQRLLDKGASPQLPDHSGEYPLHVAQSYSAHEIIRLLLKHGANPNVCNTKGQTLLHPADFEMIDMLLASGASVKIKDMDSREPIYYATIRGDEKAVNKLLEVGGSRDEFEAGCRWYKRNLGQQWPLPPRQQIDPVGFILTAYQALNMGLTAHVTLVLRQVASLGITRREAELKAFSWGSLGFAWLPHIVVAGPMRTNTISEFWDLVSF